MPSRYSSGHSESDAAGLAANLGIEVRTIAIEPGHAALLDMLAPSFDGREADLTEENLQSRIRGLLLMALSNKFGWLVLTTGNKSEMAVGYSTLYGDTAGGFAPIKDVLKTRVYDLCEWRNAQAGTDVIPRGVLDKPPSAELRPDQRDADSLPPYDELDAVLRPYIERDSTAADLLARGLRPRPGAPRRAVGRPRRVQAASDAARRAGHGEGVRQGPSPAHHQRLPRLTQSGPTACW